MEIRYHNKLVRDDILMKLAHNGVDHTYKTVKGAEKYRALKDKLLEETGEVLRAETRKEALEELADVIEVCYAIAKTIGYTQLEVQKERVLKLKERGSFDTGAFLLTTKRSAE